MFINLNLKFPNLVKGKGEKSKYHIVRDTLGYSILTACGSRISSEVAFFISQKDIFSSDRIDELCSACFGHLEIDVYLDPPNPKDMIRHIAMEGFDEKKVVDIIPVGESQNFISLDRRTK